jgi:uncharacterized protein YchJ
VGEYKVEICNPKIIKTEGPMLLVHEGCLSLPGEDFMVPRYSHVLVQCTMGLEDTYHDISTDTHDPTVVQAWQHELDHIFGRLLSDYTPESENLHIRNSWSAFFEQQMALQQRAPYRREHRKIGRNEPCPCGSNQKYKKCCLHKSEPTSEPVLEEDAKVMYDYISPPS